MLTFFGGGRGCAGALTRPSTRHLLPKNFEKTALRKRVGIFTVKMRVGHIYGKYCTGYPSHICVRASPYHLVHAHSGRCGLMTVLALYPFFIHVVFLVLLQVFPFHVVRL